MKVRTFFIGAVGGIVGAGILVLALFLLGATDVTRTETVKVTTPAVYSPTSSVAGGLSPTDIYTSQANGVVEIFATFPASGTDLFGQPQGGGQGLGSGFIVSEDGFILTNAHVVSEQGQKASDVKVVIRQGKEDVRRLAGTIVGIDESSDVALLKIDPKGLDLTVLTIGDSDEVVVGEPVVAIGNPLGYDFSLSAGIVSAIDRQLDAPNGATIYNGIQTDAAINPGNSGGPLIDSSGRVIGINEQIATTSQSATGQASNAGLGFAVPINTAKRVMDQLRTTGKAETAWLGIGMTNLTPDIAAQLGYKVEHGALITDVFEESPADKAGITAGTTTTQIMGVDYPKDSDVITVIDGQTVSGADDVINVIAAHNPGDTIKLTVQRGDTSKELTITLVARPAEANAPQTPALPSVP
jgi:S1-C subfamily serine protease